jgi:hypothetical protein
VPVDPIISLVSSVEAAPGAYALLVGSGISRAALDFTRITGNRGRYTSPGMISPLDQLTGVMESKILSGVVPLPVSPISIWSQSA